MLDFCVDVVKVEFEHHFFQVFTIELISECTKKFMCFVMYHPFLRDSMECFMDRALVHMFTK